MDEQLGGKKNDKEIDPLDPFAEPLTDKERIESLESHLNSALNKIGDLEGKLNDLQNRINKMVILDGAFETPSSHEIAQMLFNWANGS